MNNFLQRAITGAFFVAFIVFMTMFSQWTFMVLLMLIAGLGMNEYLNIVLKNKTKFRHLLWVIIGPLMIYFISKYNPTILLFLAPIIFSIIALMVLFSEERNWNEIGHLMISVFYVPVPLSMFYYAVYVDEPEFGPNDLVVKGSLLALNLFILIWSSDTFAYLSGKAFGKHKMFAKVSPGKTWEGFVGAAILTIGMSYLLSYFFEIPSEANAIIAVLTVVFGTMGDLVESMLKREYGIKDSGNILPGHGGVLDRFDALLISLPFTTAVYMIWRIFI